MLNTLKQINSTSAFNRWAGFEVTRAETGGDRRRDSGAGRVALTV